MAILSTAIYSGPLIVSSFHEGDTIQVESLETTSATRSTMSAVFPKHFCMLQQEVLSRRPLPAHNHESMHNV